jgi:uncharacterized phiE125 gp8 family phage protein
MIIKENKKSNQRILTLQEAKEHLRILHHHEDFYIDSLLYVITTTIENELDKDLVDTQYQMNIYNKIGINEEVYFSNAPVVLVESVVLKIGSTIIDPSLYSYVNSDEYIKFITLPEDFTEIIITFKKGFESYEDIPAPIKQAAKLLLSDLYQFRGTIVVGKSVFIIEKAIQRLLQPYRRVSFY